MLVRDNDIACNIHLNQSNEQDFINSKCNQCQIREKNVIFFICAGLLHCLGLLIMNFMLTLSNIPCVHTIILEHIRLFSPNA
jgi:hypothetical protein